MTKQKFFDKYLAAAKNTVLSFDIEPFGNSYNFKILKSRNKESKMPDIKEIVKRWLTVRPGAGKRRRVDEIISRFNIRREHDTEEAIAEYFFAFGSDPQSKLDYSKTPASQSTAATITYSREHAKEFMRNLALSTDDDDDLVCSCCGEYISTDSIDKKKPNDWHQESCEVRKFLDQY